MGKLLSILAVAVLLCAARSDALDLGPIHIHGTDVKVGGEVNFDITVDKTTKEEVKTGEEAKLSTIYGHRKDDEKDKFEISVPYADLDKDSKDLLKSLENSKTYKMKVKRMDENWKLIRLREK